MKVAVSTDDGRVAQHFGRCQSYTLAKLDGQKIVDKTVLANPGHEPGFLPAFLAEKGIKCIIAGGMGRRAQELFKKAGIETVVGITGEVEAVLAKYGRGELFSSEEFCDH